MPKFLLFCFGLYALAFLAALFGFHLREKLRTKRGNIQILFTVTISALSFAISAILTISATLLLGYFVQESLFCTINEMITLCCLIIALIFSLERLEKDNEIPTLKKERL